ncbi:hypothetical protein H5410_045097 [Solanum commersonii]|uniref:Replication factor A C-terminal domain-containing protein n=1 Tax=Solanum commersonii TaxID=4109 RepID=A0A9J5XAJ3_SOLCO|nr:hypothetical protein H5410_045097 [Solanum commersonii]
MPGVKIVSLISPGTFTHRDSAHMIIDIELAKQSQPINKIPKRSIDSVMRVLVIRRGSIIPYNNSRHEGTFRTIILVDEEGTKIQATLFNKHIETWKDSLKPNKRYYIAKGRLDRVNPNYSSVHKEVELTFIDNTIIDETSHEVSTLKFSDGFVSLDHADKLPNGAILGTFGISTIPVSSILINLMFQKAMDLRAWREIIKAENKDIIVTPSRVMRRAIKVPLPHILDGLLADSQDSMYKFKEKIIDVINIDEPWYSSCKKCHKKVTFIDETTACTNCNIENVEYEMRYCLRLEMCGGEQRARVILFEATKFLLGCTVQEYIQSTSVKKEECKNYRKLVLTKDKEYNFLVRIDKNEPNPPRNLIAQEIYPLEDEAPTIVEDEEKLAPLGRKRTKKIKDETPQIKQKTKSRKK